MSVNIAHALAPAREDPEDRSSRRACEAWLRVYGPWVWTLKAATR